MMQLDAVHTGHAAKIALSSAKWRENLETIPSNDVSFRVSEVS